MAIKFIDPSEAPAPPANTIATNPYYTEVIQTLPDDKVAVVDIPEGKTVRGAKVSLGRIASSFGIRVMVWTDEDDESKVYVQKIGEKS